MPPVFVFFLEFCDDVGVLGGEVVFLHEVIVDVEELLVVDEAPFLGADGAYEFCFLFGEALGAPAAFVEEEGAVGPCCGGVFEEREE